MKNIKYLLILLPLLILSSCADVSPHTSDCITSDPYGFFSGIWHGFILPFSLIFSIFSDDIAVYAYNNTGWWYDFGFIIGIGILYKK